MHAPISGHPLLVNHQSLLIPESICPQDHAANLHWVKQHVTAARFSNDPSRRCILLVPGDVSDSILVLRFVHG